MAYVVPTDELAAKEAESNDSKPIPAGKYILQIVTTRRDGAGIEMGPFAKEGPNAGKHVLRLRLKVVGGQYDGRNLFARVGLFTRFAPTQKNPQGAVNRTFFQFFKAVGIENPAGDPLPDENEWAALLGKKVEAVVKVTDPDEYNPSGSNEVAFFNPCAPDAVTGSEGAPAATIPANVWGQAPAQANPWAEQSETAPQQAWDPNGPTL